PTTTTPVSAFCILANCSSGIGRARSRAHDKRVTGGLGVVDHDILDVGVLVKGFLAPLAAVAAELDAAEWCLSCARAVSVDPHDPRAQFVRHSLCARDVLGPQARG